MISITIVRCFTGRRSAGFQLWPRQDFTIKRTTAMFSGSLVLKQWLYVNGARTPERGVKEL